MQLNDAVPERRNLIVFCMATIIFFIGGGDACGGVKLPFGGIILTNFTGLIFLYWATLIYLVLRYWSVFKSMAYDPESDDHLRRNKNCKTAIQEAIIRSANVSSLRIPQTWYSQGNHTELSFVEAIKKIGLSLDEAKDKITLVRSSEKSIEQDSYPLVLQVKKVRNGMIQSKEIKVRSLRYGPVFLIYLLIRIFSDKYLFDWVFPLLILGVTLLTMVGGLLAFDYSLCPPAALPPGSS
tara:strand:- start:1478 stop:2191 length:714 start_codon:yes stop_codon:yes gene_type:complete